MIAPEYSRDAKLEARRQRRRSPQVAGILPRSIYGHASELQAWEKALDAARGNIRAVPVMANRRWIGVVQGRDATTPEVRGAPLRKGATDDEIAQLCAFYDEDRRLDSLKRADQIARRTRIDFADIQTPSDITTAIAAGRFVEKYWWKNSGTATVANNWYDEWPVGGNPTNGLINGTARTMVTFDDTSQGALTHGGAVSTYIKRLLSMMGMASAQTPTFEIYDRGGAYDQCSFTAGSQNFTNTLTPARYMATGQGLLPVGCTNTVLSATAANLTVVTYVNDANTGSRLMPTGTNVAVIVSAAAPTATLGARVVVPSTTGDTKTWGFSIPLQAGDAGARQLTNYTWSAANTGTMTWAMIQPLARVIVPVSAIPSEIDLFFQIMRIPRVYDGACLGILSYHSGTGASILGGAFSACWN